MLCTWTICFINKKIIRFKNKTLLEQPKLSTKTYGYRSFKYYGSTLWNVLPFGMNITDNYNEFKVKLNTWCHKSDLDKLEIFFFSFLFFFFFFFFVLGKLSLLLLSLVSSSLVSSLSWLSLSWWRLILHPNVYRMGQFAPLLFLQEIFLLMYMSVDLCYWSNYYSH